MKNIYSVFLTALVLLASACTAPTDVEPSPLATDAPFVTATPESTVVPTPTESPNPEEQQPYYYSDEFESNTGYSSLVYDVNEDGIDDTICISYQVATEGEWRNRKVVAIAYGGPKERKEGDITYIVRDSVLIQETLDFLASDDAQITCIKLADGFLILEDTKDIGGSRVHQTMHAYYFNGNVIYPMPTQFGLYVEDILVKFTGEKEYQLTFIPTGQKFNGVVPDEHYESELKFDKEYYDTGENIVLSVNTVTGEVIMRIGVDIGGYKDFQSVFLDVTFEYDKAMHNYKISNADFMYDDGANSAQFDDLTDYYEKHGTEYITP